jgi:fructose-1,6-bisphosphatase-3
MCTAMILASTSAKPSPRNTQNNSADVPDAPAITIIQLKLEINYPAQTALLMDDRLLLDKIDYAKGIICLDGQIYPLQDTHFPTIDPDLPYELTEQEQSVVERLKLSFIHSERLQKHVHFLYAKGSMYLVHNGNLLYHGCIPMNEEGSFKSFKMEGQEFTAKAFMDRAERLVRQGYFAADPEQRQYGQDSMWYLWSGAQSPLFGKAKMSTFERYFLEDVSTHEEKMDPYYAYRDQEETAKWMQEFGLDPTPPTLLTGMFRSRSRRARSQLKPEGGSL